MFAIWNRWTFKIPVVILVFCLMIVGSGGGGRRRIGNIPADCGCSIFARNGSGRCIAGREVGQITEPRSWLGVRHRRFKGNYSRTGIKRSTRLLMGCSSSTPPISTIIVSKSSNDQTIKWNDCDRQKKGRDLAGKVAGLPKTDVDGGDKAGTRFCKESDLQWI